MAKALNQNGLDSEGRKLGERPGLDIENFVEIYNVSENEVFN